MASPSAAGPTARAGERDAGDDLRDSANGGAGRRTPRTTADDRPVRVGPRAVVVAPPTTAVAPTTTTAIPDDAPRFHVVGTQIIGPDGRPFLMRGVNKSGLEWSPTGYGMSWSTWLTMASWGVNTVRLPLSPAYWLPSMCTYDPDYVARVDQAVKWSEALSMLIILDDHYATRGRTCGGAVGFSAEQEMADAYSQQLVAGLAARYKNHPYVAFDLYNEPHGISDAVWRNGGPAAGLQTVGMQTLLDTVRAAGAPNLVFVSGNEWANDIRPVVERRLRNDGDVVYAVHAYPIWCGGFVPATVAYMCQGKGYPPFLDTVVGPASASLPVVLTEFGTQRDGPADVQAVIDWAHRYGVGWTAWVWAAGGTGAYGLLADPSGTPSATGAPVRAAMWAAKGWTAGG